MVKRLVVIALVAATGLTAATAFGASRSPRVQLGMSGNPASFDSMTGQHSTSRLIIIGWGQDRSFANYFSNLFGTMLQEPMLGIGVPNGSGLTPKGIANGKGDAFLLRLNAAVANFDMPIYIRPLAEMNGHWNSYCAYNANGSSRGPLYSTSAFKKAFARIDLIVKGNPNTNSLLAGMHLPPVRGQLMAAPMVQMIWNPQGFGSPNLPGNSAAAYYPGNRYVDVVGDDLYDIHGKAEWAAANAMYRRWRNKVFAFPEWGLWDIDDPAFIRAMYNFLVGHRRTQVVSYYNGNPGSIFDLRSKPRSRALYRQLISRLN